VRSTISPCSLSTMTSKLSNLWPSMVPTQRKGGALIELKLGCIGTGTTRRARLSENRRDDFTPSIGRTRIGPLNTMFSASSSAHPGGCRLTGFP
jgi:hypothetical protein